MKIFAKILSVLSWAIFIFILVDLPMPETKALGIPFFDKGVHFFIFGVLVFLIMSVLKENKKFNFTFIALASFLLSSSYSAITEYWQNYIFGRNPSLFDFLAGVAGIVAVIFLTPRPPFKRGAKEGLLLHICCIGCGAYVAEELKREYELILYFFNPNIFPKEEYDKRLQETKKIADKLSLKLIVEKYDHEKWLETVKGMEKEPEGGKRCGVCYKYRLDEAAKLAKGNKCQFFASTLSISPHKNTNIINEVGNELAKKYGVKFLDKDFKENDGFKKSCHLSKELNLYRQNYCGCEFSIRKR